MGRGRSDLDPDPYLEPRSLIFEPLSISAWTSIPSLFLPQPLATSIQLPLWTPPFQTPPCPPAHLVSSLPQPRNLGSVLRAEGWMMVPVFLSRKVMGRDRPKLPQGTDSPEGRSSCPRIGGAA